MTPTRAARPRAVVVDDVRVRLMTRDDGIAVDAVFDGMSATSRYRRFHGPMPRLGARVRAALLDLDDHRRLALVAEVGDPDHRLAIGIARLVATDKHTAEIALAVVDAWQRRGVGRRLLEALGERATELGYRELHGVVLPDNPVVLRLLRRVFPGTTRHWADDVIHVRCPLVATGRLGLGSTSDGRLHLVA